MAKYTIQLPGCEYGSSNLTMLRSNGPGHREVVWEGTIDELVSMFDVSEVACMSTEDSWDAFGIRAGTVEQGGWFATVHTELTTSDVLPGER
jgi:hypothetical protein